MNTNNPQNDTNINSESNKKKPKKIRCAVCNKGKGMLLLECKCGNHYCSKHRMFEAHNCTFDYKAEARKLLESELMAAKAIKTINSFT